MREAFDPSGPAVQLADSSSIFPHQLAREWIRRGIPSAIATTRAAGHAPNDPAVPILRSKDYETEALRRARRITKPVLRRLERAMPRWRSAHYTRRTGRAAPDAWEWLWVSQLWGSRPLARAALSLRPRFVFAHEVSSYGFAASLCLGVPKILFPWGGDVFNYVESSAAVDWLTTRALHRADLVVPSSFTAARHIRERFGLSEEIVQPISWGVDRKTFSQRSPESRAAFCRELGIDPARVLVLNSRRFRPAWGSSLALDAFLRLAERRADVHCLLLSGSGDEEHVAEARRRIEAAGLAARFTLFPPDVPLARCAEIMAASDVFVSLMGRGDMRSASVIQGAACGGAPVILDAPEYREMARLGFACELVPEDTGAVVAALDALAADPARRAAMRERNRLYVEEHEDFERQMQVLLDRIDAASRPYRERLRSVS